MYNPIDNSFTDSIFQCMGNDRLYHLENTYYIRYNCKKAIHAIDMIFNYPLTMDMERDSFYYHIHVDMLFQAIGAINDRFIMKKRKKNSNISLNIERNIKEYCFSSEKYPIISNKNIRNYIEHIYQKSDRLIDNNIFFGTFNFIHSKMSDKLIKELRSDERPQNNYLDMIDKTYVIINIDKNFEKEIVSLEKLRIEVEKILKCSENIWNYLIK